MPSGRLAVMVARTLVFVIVRRVLGLVGLGPTPDAKDVEIAVLRHQLMVVRRQVARPRYTPQDRLVLAMLARLLPRDRWPALLVTPSTLLRWHRELVARRWTYPPTGRRQPGLADEVVELVRGWPGRTGAGGICGLSGSAASSVCGCRPPRCGGSCAGTASRRTGVDGLPTCAGCRDTGVRFLHRGDGRADPAVPAVRGRAGAASGAPGRDHRASDRAVGGAGGPEPADGPRRPSRSVPVPDPRPGQQVHRRVRRGICRGPY